MGRFLTSLTFWKKDATFHKWHIPLDTLIDEWIASQSEEATEQPVVLPYDLPKGEVSNQRHETVDPSPQAVFEGQDGSQANYDNHATGIRELEREPLEFATELPSLELAIENSLANMRTDSTRLGGTTIEAELLQEQEQPKHLTSLDDREVENEQRVLRQIVMDRQGVLVKKAVMSKAPRRKYVDARRTIRLLARNGGLFHEFRYRESPSTSSAYTQPIDLLVIGDVSGSMGRYIAVVLHLLTSLQKVAKVTSYIFSDTPTYVGNRNTSSSFRSLYEDLQQRATSWAFGTRLSVALEQVRQERRYTESTIVLLITDGGFSLIGNDWADTVKHLVGLQAETNQLIVATPNPVLVEEGAICGERLWNVERNAIPFHEIISSAERVKVARFGLLSRYSHRVIPCTTTQDIQNFIQSLIESITQ